jgi:hypothetical protein
MKTKYIVVGFCDSLSCSPKAGKYVLKTRLGGTTCPTCKGALYMQRQQRTTDNHYEVQFEKRTVETKPNR